MRIYRVAQWCAALVASESARVRTPAAPFFLPPFPFCALTHRWGCLSASQPLFYFFPCAVARWARPSSFIASGLPGWAQYRAVGTDCLCAIFFAQELFQFPKWAQINSICSKFPMHAMWAPLLQIQHVAYAFGVDFHKEDHGALLFLFWVSNILDVAV